jgi:hypothetical protein
VLETLACYTRTPDECYFCVWDGWGLDIEGGDGARILGVGRTKGCRPQPHLLLVSGETDRLRRLGSGRDVAGPTQVTHSGSRVHLAGRRIWCVTNDVDPHWAGIGADRSAIDRLVAGPRLDVVRADSMRTRRTTSSPNNL